MTLDLFYIQQTFQHNGKPGLFHACYGSIKFGSAFTHEAAQALVDKARGNEGFRAMIEIRNAEYEANLSWTAWRFRNDGGGRALVVVPLGQGRG